MHVKNQDYFHIHNTTSNFYETLWQVGSEINFSTRQMNLFNHFYDTYFPKLTVNHSDFPLLEGVEMWLQGNDFSKRDENKIVIQKLLEATKESAKYMREIVFEEVRASYFPSLPSRRSCIWLCEKDAVDYWLSTLGQGYEVYKLNVTGVLHIADQKHLHADVLPCEIIRKRAFEYWTGSDGLNPNEQELLFEGIIKIVEKIQK